MSCNTLGTVLLCTIFGSSVYTVWSLNTLVYTLNLDLAHFACTMSCSSYKHWQLRQSLGNVVGISLHAQPNPSWGLRLACSLSSQHSNHAVSLLTDSFLIFVAS